jgi:addiction module HigA family antidote
MFGHQRVVTQAELADRIDVSYPRINEIINDLRGITPDTALRLAKLLGTSAARTRRLHLSSAYKSG